MTRRNTLILITGFFVVLTCYLWSIQQKKTNQEFKTLIEPSARPVHKIDVEKLRIDGRKVVGLTPGKEEEELQKIKVMNTPSPDWEVGLKTVLQNQSGNSLEKITLKKIDSFVWFYQGIPLFVESVIVTIRNQENHPVNFRVLVDSQTGKILQSWDQPVIDPMDPRTNFKIKVDPRYHSDN